MPSRGAQVTEPRPLGAMANTSYGLASAARKLGRGGRPSCPSRSLLLPKPGAQCGRASMTAGFRRVAERDACPWRRSTMARLASGLAVLTLTLAACSSGDDYAPDCPSTLTQSMAATSCPDGAPATGPQAKRTFNYELSTHCGIRWARFAGKRWITAPLGVRGNAPPGWGNPVQQGQVHLLSKDRAIFTSDGHEPLEFRATSKHWPEPGCA
jgi:hypothetical protein